MFTIVKGLAYKFCFCLGLGTVTYYSYGEVQKLVHVDQVKVIENVVEKHVSRETTVYDDLYTPQEISYEQSTIPPMLAAPAASTEDAAAVVPPLAPVAEEKKEEEKKDETAEKKDENTDAVAGGIIIPNQGAPILYAPQLGRTISNATEDEKPHSPEVPMLPNVLPTPTPSPSSSGGYAGNTSNSYVPSFGSLDANDIAALIAPMKASFDDEMNQANGLLCVVDGHSCDRRNHVSLHSLRWGMEEGLKKDVSFKIKSSGATSLEFLFDFKIQNSALAEEVVSMTAHPTDILVHQESRDAKTYRVIEFKFPDLSVRGDVIKQVHAVMTYEVTAAGLILNQDSGLSFTRSKVQTLVSKWEQLGTDSGADRVPAAQSGVFLIADEVTFSMSIEKSW